MVKVEEIQVHLGDMITSFHLEFAFPYASELYFHMFTLLRPGLLYENVIHPHPDHKCGCAGSHIGCAVC